MEQKVIHVACPCCGNRRLFDLDINTEGVIGIKCPKCRAVVAITIHKKRIKAEQTDAC